MVQKLTFHDEPFSEMEAFDAFDFDEESMFSAESEDSYSDEAPVKTEKRGTRRSSKRANRPSLPA